MDSQDFSDLMSTAETEATMWARRAVETVQAQQKQGRNYTYYKGRRQIVLSVRLGERELTNAVVLSWTESFDELKCAITMDMISKEYWILHTVDQSQFNAFLYQVCGDANTGVELFFYDNGSVELRYHLKPVGVACAFYFGPRNTDREVKPETPILEPLPIRATNRYESGRAQVGSVGTLIARATALVNELRL